MLLVILSMTFLTACTTVRSNSIACPQVVNYTLEEQRQAKLEIEQGIGSMTERLITDYGDMRDRARICNS